MKYFTFLALFLLGLSVLSAQVVDRYPYIQQPTETSVLVAWNTSTSARGTIIWGNSPSNLSNSKVDVAATQKHALTIDGLQANTKYYYQVSTDAGYTSAIEHFWTAKPLAERQISFLHYGDCGYNNTIQNQIAGLMEQEEVDFAVVAGDVDQGIGDAYDNVFFGVYKNMVARDCHYTAIGNHDIIANNGADFFDAFYQPTNNPQQSEHYYTFTWGNAKFICLDSNGDYSLGSDQHNFLLSELKCRDQEWVFVFFHHPPWTNAWDPTYYVPFQTWYEYDGEDAMRTDLVPYFEQYKVDFVLNGHSHCYQRGNLNGVEYVISGGAGTTSPDTKKCNSFPNFNACAPNIQQELYINEYVRFKIDGDAVTYVCIDPSGNVVDSVTVTKIWTAFDATVSFSNATASNATDGSLSVTASGGNPPYSYLWSTGDTTSEIQNLGPGSYGLTVTDNFGCERTMIGIVGVSVGVQNSFSDPDLRISPNPANARFTLDFPNPSHHPHTLEIFDIDGKRIRLIEGISSTSINIDTRTFPDGIYLIRLNGKSGQHSGKLIVRH